LDEEGLSSVAGDEDDAVAAAFEDAGLGVHLEAAAVVHTGVAAVAVGLKDGENFGGVKLDRSRGRIGVGLGGDGVGWTQSGGQTYGGEGGSGYGESDARKKMRGVLEVERHRVSCLRCLRCGRSGVLQG
jgi:hypothetical protein